METTVWSSAIMTPMLAYSFYLSVKKKKSLKNLMSKNEKLALLFILFYKLSFTSLH